MTLKSKTESPSSQDTSRTHETEPALEKMPNKRVTANLPHFEPLLDDVQVAALLGGLHRKTVQRMARDGQIPAIRVGRFWRFRASELDHWIQLQSTSRTARVA